MGLVWRWLEQFYLSLTHVPLFGKSSSATPWTKHSMVGGFKRQNNIITFFLFILLWWLRSLLSPGTGESLLAKCRRVIITACLDCALAVDAERSISVWIYMDSLFVQVSLHLENKCFILPLLLEKSFFFSTLQMSSFDKVPQLLLPVFLSSNNMSPYDVPGFMYFTFLRFFFYPQFVNWFKIASYLPPGKSLTLHNKS